MKKIVPKKTPPTQTIVYNNTKSFYQTPMKSTHRITINTKRLLENTKYSSISYKTRMIYLKLEPRIEEKVYLA